MDALTTPPAGLTASLPRTAPVADREKALAVAREFEAVFLADAFKAMMKDIPADPLGGGSASESWRELLVDEYARDMVRRGGLGLAEAVADELMKIQEASSR